MGIFNTAVNWVFGRKRGDFNTPQGNVPALSDSHITPANLDISQVGMVEFPYSDKHLGCDLFDQATAQGDIAFSKELSAAAKRSIPVYNARIKALKDMGKLTKVHGKYVRSALNFGYQVQSQRIGIANHAHGVQQRLTDAANAHQQRASEKRAQAFDRIGRKV